MGPQAVRPGRVEERGRTGLKEEEGVEDERRKEEERGSGKWKEGGESRDRETTLTNCTSIHKSSENECLVNKRVQRRKTG